MDRDTFNSFESCCSSNIASTSVKSTVISDSSEVSISKVFVNNVDTASVYPFILFFLSSLPNNRCALIKSITTLYAAFMNGFVTR